MSIEQYSTLINILPQIEEALKEKGETIPRPDYSGNTPVKDEQNDSDDDDEVHDKKANIETTSDEEE